MLLDQVGSCYRCLPVPKKTCHCSARVCLVSCMSCIAGSYLTLNPYTCANILLSSCDTILPHDLFMCAGPGSYEQSAAGATKPASPKWSMQGLGHGSLGQPSACSGAYDITHVGSVGKPQVISKHKSPPRTQFGTGRREASEVLYSLDTVTPR